MNETLIRVNYCDEKIGVGEKMELHNSPILHRAFSVFIVHEDKMLIHRRSIGKYHSGGLWTNACCSHMRDGVSEIDAIRNRLIVELGITATPEYITKFVYYHKFDENLYEFEYDHVYLLDYDGGFSVNPEEIEEISWVDIEWLAMDIVKEPSKYTVWFVSAFGFVYDYIRKKRRI